MGAMFGNLDHAAELEAPSVRAGRFTLTQALFTQAPLCLPVGPTTYNALNRTGLLGITLAAWVTDA